MEETTWRGPFMVVAMLKSEPSTPSLNTSPHTRNPKPQTPNPRAQAAGLNAVRIPFGYWIVSGPTEEDPYQGPDLDALDRLVRNPTPYTPHPKPQTSNPKPQTRNPKPQTRNPKPETRDPKPETRIPKPQKPSPNPDPETLNPTP